MPVNYKLVPMLDACDFPTEVDDELATAGLSTHDSGDDLYLTEEDFPLMFNWVKENTDLLRNGVEEVYICWSGT